MPEAVAEQEIITRGYVPAPEQPSWFRARMDALLGRTLDGRPKLRVVWGCDAVGFPNADPDEPKYVNPDDPEQGWDCWILEQFVGPEFFGDPDTWERGRWGWSEEGRRVELMAPYPSRGEYVFIMPLSSPSGEPLPLNDEVADFVASLVRSLHNRPHNAYTNQEQIAKRMADVREWREQKRAASEARLGEIRERHRSKAEQTNTESTRAWSMPSVTEGARALASKILKRGTE
jgi:hypothetical protein